MKKLILLGILAGFFGAGNAFADMVYSNPPILQETSQGVEIYFDASNTALENITPSTKLYCHTGVFTNIKPTEWTYATKWGGTSDTEKYQLTNQDGTTVWKLYIGNIREFYGITNPEELVTSLNFVFKLAGSQNVIQSEDYFLPVKADGLQVSLTSDSNGNVIAGETGYVNFTVYATQPSTLTLSVDGTQIATVSNSQTLNQDYTFTTVGEHTVTATATNSNGETATEEIVYNYLGAAQQVNYPGGTPVMGPVANADGSVTFCLGAIDKHHVVLMGSWNNYEFTTDQVMNYQDTDNGRYFWVTVPDLDPSMMYVYYFVIDGGRYIVGDPYARLVLDPYNDKYLDTSAFIGLPAYPTEALNGQNVPVAVYYGNINEYDWQVEEFEIPQKSDLIIYELLFRDFTGTEGKANGNGTVKLALEKLPYLKELGVNAIELLPIMEFNGNISWGYNPNFYFAIDKAYGTPDDYKEFIDACHQNGMAVILDMVFNQSDGLHPWYQMYPVSSNPYYNRNAPHAYSVLNDWNQGVPMVQEQWADVLRYWMTEYKFDGFRFDLVKGLGLNESYPNSGDAATNQYNASRVAEMRYLQSVMDEINPNAIFINENLAGSQEENEMADTGQLNWANINDAACQFAMGYSSNSNMNRLYAPKDARTWGSTVSYLESHDEQRLAYKQDQWGVNGVKGDVRTSTWRLGAAAAQMILTPGAHMIWQFSEMGNAQNTKNNDGGNNTDPKIVNWALLDEPWHYGLYTTYCQLISLRLDNPELFAKDASFVINCGQTNWENGRWLYSVSADKSKELYTLINPNITGELTISNVPFLSKDNANYQVVARTYGSQPSFNAEAGTVTIPANAFISIASSNTISGIESISTEATLNSLRVYGAPGEVVVDYAAEGAVIYSLDGKVIGSVAESGRVSVASGLYIVKSGKESVKVVVK